jgi:hypothetical protein
MGGRADDYESREASADETDVDESLRAAPIPNSRSVPL